MTKAFRTTTELGYHDGFQMTFKNGCTISVQFSEHTYSDGGKTTAEVAAWDDKGNWLMFDGEKWSDIEDSSDVMSHQSSDSVAIMISELAKVK